jgi:hypothetical protein
MTILLFMLVAIALLAALGALAQVIGADSRDQVGDAHSGHAPQRSI